jgi:fructose-1,6-bisphosphatase/sedoheptulose 1,7-bisphosphatase-like protein
MDKLVCGPDGVGVVDIDRPIGENIRALAKAKGVDVSDIRVAVLDRPRHCHPPMSLARTNAQPKELRPNRPIGLG